jgi:hypothetical protein
MTPDLEDTAPAPVEPEQSIGDAIGGPLPSESAPEPVTELDDALKEFESPEKPEGDAPADQDTPSYEEVAAERDHLKEAQAYYDAIHAERAQLSWERDRFDFEQALEHVHEQLRDVGNFDYGTLKERLAGAYELDPQIKAAWDNRRSNPQNFMMRLGKFVDRIRSDQAQLYDPHVSADRFAVSAAVKGQSNNKPVERRTDWANISNEEFLREQEQQFGFRNSRLG